MISNTLLSVFFCALAASVPVVRGCADCTCAGPTCKGPTERWKDSYSIGGKCYCDTTFDHEIGTYKVTDTSTGEEITVREACARVGQGPSGDRLYYNDIQCGNGPINDAGDESWCPGRVDFGAGNQDGCGIIGPKWFFPGGSQETPQEPEQPVPQATPTSSPALFVEEEEVEEVAGSLLTGLTVTDLSDGSSSPLGDSIVVSNYPSGFNLRAEVSDSSLIETVTFMASDGSSTTERHETYDMFGSKGQWDNAGDLVGSTVVVTVEANTKDGLSESIEANIFFE